MRFPRPLHMASLPAWLAVVLLAGCGGGGGPGFFPGDAGNVPPADLLPPPGDGGAGSCASGSRDGDETDVDCGGATCAPCAGGRGCLHASDCASGTCSNLLCTTASCSD